MPYATTTVTNQKKGHGTNKIAFHVAPAQISFTKCMPAPGADSMRAASSSYGGFLS